MEVINIDKLHEYAIRFCKPGVTALAKRIAGYIESESKATKIL
jgi:hypothetical protein